jgi:hypothetical protein
MKGELFWFSVRDFSARCLGPMAFGVVVRQHVMIEETVQLLVGQGERKRERERERERETERQVSILQGCTSNHLTSFH